MGEVAQLFIGISLALLANSLYEQWRERRDEIALLEQPGATLEQDLEAIEGGYELMRRFESRLPRSMRMIFLDLFPLQ